ncbi:MAG: tyrosine-type recombinase/integrase [Verrucomicrobia bacterium]|jgi:integrase|nr:tyrosine-type recombinase/integrase [Verrucomicrobiota bacterium]
MPRKKKLKQPVTKYQGQRIRYIPESDTWAADYNAVGERARKRFKSEEAAKIWIDQKAIETKNKGRGAFGLDDRDRLDVAEFRRGTPSMPLADVFDFWHKHHPKGEQRTIEQVVEEFLSPKTMGRRGNKPIKRREATVETLRKRLSHFTPVFADHQAHEITQHDIEQWLDVNRWGGINRRHYLASVRALFRFAMRKNYVAMNPAAEIETPDVETAEPVIMTASDVEKYLNAMLTASQVTVNKATGVKYENDCVDLLPRESIAFFCGLRPEELSRLDWRNVSLDNKLITVSGDVAKVQGHRRNVEMPDNLIQWLAPYAKDSGPVWPYKSPTTLVRKRKRAREAAGVEVPDNAGRHAFASYHLAANENAPATAEAMGHSDIKLLRNTYRNITASDGRPITKAAGEKYFKIVPKRKGNVIQMSKIA